MNQEYWQQQADDPLFPNMLWTRPETKQGAGKLLIIGGQAQEFIHVAESFAQSEAAGAGTVRVLMPDSTRKLTKMLPNIEYASSNTSGSFAKSALAELLDASQWADGVLLAGDLGKNSETSLMLESYIGTYRALLVISGAALISVIMPAKDLFKREQTILVINFAQLQKFAIELGLQTPLTSHTTNPVFAGLLHEITRDYEVTLVVEREKIIWNTSNGRVASTLQVGENTTGLLVATTSVWSIQNQSKLFEAGGMATYIAAKPAK